MRKKERGERGGEEKMMKQSIVFLTSIYENKIVFSYYHGCSIAGRGVWRGAQWGGGRTGTIYTQFLNICINFCMKKF